MYKVKLVATEQSPSHDNYIMTVLSVIKTGMTVVWGQGHCGGHLGLGTGREGGLVALRWRGDTQVGWGHSMVMGTLIGKGHQGGWWHQGGLGTPNSDGDTH